MEQQNTAPKNDDITEEPYKGPGRFITAMGEGAAIHYATGIGGLIGGGALSGLAYKQVNKVEKGFADFFEKNRNSTSILKKLAANVAGATRFVAHKSVEHLPRRERIFAHIPKERLEAVIFGGGLAGFAGFFIVPIFSAFSGIRHANEGRNQFERAKDEVRTTRAERDALRDKYVEATVALETYKAQGAATAPVDQTTPSNLADHVIAPLAASPTYPEPPRIEAPPVREPVIGPAPTTGRVLDRDVAPLAASPTYPEPPRIEAPPVREPVIGPAQTTGRVLDQDVAPLAASPTYPEPPRIEAPPVREPVIGPAQTTGRVLDRDTSAQSWAEHAQETRTAPQSALTH